MISYTWVLSRPSLLQKRRQGDYTNDSFHYGGRRKRNPPVNPNLRDRPLVSRLFADITAKGDTKQKGIDEIIRYFDIRLEDTMAFGDGGNDISMLRHAAIGVAMGQAEKDVKAAADYVTAPIDEDGISKAMKHFGII